MSNGARSGADRRVHPRQDVQLTVFAAGIGEVVGSVTSDLSLGGLFLRTDKFHKQGSLISMTLVDPQGEEISVMGRVVRVARDGSEKVMGLGIKFLSSSPDHENRIRQLLSTGTSDRAEGSIEWHAVPRLISAWPPDLTSLEMHLLGFVDGKQKMEDVLRVCGVPVPEAWEALQGLRDKKIVAWSTPQPVTTDAPTLAPAAPASAPVPQPSGKNQAFVTERVQSYVARADAAVKSGDLPEAVRSLQLALALRGPHVPMIHIKLAVLALERIGDLEMAREHAIAAKVLAPENEAIGRVLQRIAMKEAEAAVVDPTQPASPRGAPGGRRRTLLIAIGSLVAALVGWNLWTFVLAKPWSDRPKSVGVEWVADKVPATKARHAKGSIYLTVPTSWASTDAADREAALAEAALRAQNQFDVSHLIVLDESPKVLGVVRDGRVRVY